MTDYPQNFLNLLNSVKAKRPKTVIQHILQHGFITSEELKTLYGYNHPPRAVRDVREYGIPIVTKRIQGSDGRSIAVYEFGNPSDVGAVSSKATGRTVLAKSLKKALIDKYGAHCFIYLEPMSEALLQVDHRIPYEIAGDNAQNNLEDFMLLSPSANRAKSWACEHCINWKERNPSLCVRCYWANPDDYDHIAGKQQRSIAILFTDDEIEDYQKLVDQVGDQNAQRVIKQLIKSYLK